jgi:transposase
MQGSISLVGLDVHASQTHAAILDCATGELRGVRLRMAPTKVVEFLADLPGPVRAVYEAGPTGFGLARAAAERGLDVRVVAAGKVPRACGDRVKTDKRDAERLARLLAAGELRFAFVPSVADEQFRDVIRAIEDCRGDLMRARHRLSKFLLRRDVRWAGPGSAWTQKHMSWLRSLRFEDGCSQATFIDYLSGVEMLLARRAALLAALEQAIPDSRHAPVIAALRCFRGIDTLSAAGLCAEVGDFKRFSKPKQLSGFLGIVPSEHTSDLKRRQGAITKAGCTHARRLLVEAAHHYRHRPAIGDTLARRQHGQDPRVIAIAWRAQRRLHQRWQLLAGQRRKPAGVVAIACARELAAFCWEAATLNE